MRLSQAQLLAEDAMKAEGHRQASMILAVNLGSHGEKHQIERVLRDLAGGDSRKDAQKNADDLIAKLERGGQVGL